MEKIKRTVKRFNNICPETHWMLLWAFRISCLIMLCSLIIFISLDGFDARKLSTYISAVEMFKLPASVLLLASILSFISEDYFGNK